MDGKQTTRRGRERMVLVLLVVAYASLYLCRPNIEPGFNLLAVKYGYENEQTGFVFSVGARPHAVGQVVLGGGGCVMAGVATAPEIDSRLTPSWRRYRLSAKVDSGPRWPTRCWKP